MMKIKHKSNPIISEEENFLNKEELKFVNTFTDVNSDICWKFSYATMGAYMHHFFSHMIIDRKYADNDIPAVIESPHLEFFRGIFLRYCEKHNIKHELIYRMNINFTGHSQKDFFCSAHVDHGYEHKIMLLYLSESGGNTVLFNEIGPDFDENVPDVDDVNVNPDELSIYKEIPPKQGKVVVFDGKHLHAARPCGDGEKRIVCVITFK